MPIFASGNSCNTASAHDVGGGMAHPVQQSLFGAYRAGLVGAVV